MFGEMEGHLCIGNVCKGPISMSNSRCGGDCDFFVCVKDPSQFLILDVVVIVVFLCVKNVLRCACVAPCVEVRGVEIGGGGVGIGNEGCAVIDVNVSIDL